MSCNKTLDSSSLLKSDLLGHLSFKDRKQSQSQKQFWSIGVILNSLWWWSRPLYTTCKFIYVWYGTGYNFPHWSPTLSGLMLVLSVPVLTRSPSRLQFLLAIATRLPFWQGPADLKCRVTLFGLGQHSEYQWNFQNSPWPSSVECVHLQQYPHNESTYTCKCISTWQLCTEKAMLVGGYLQHYFCRWCRFLLLVCSGRRVFSSSPRLPARLWPDTGWH